MCMPKRKTKFRFLDKGSSKPSFVQLKWTFTRSNRYQTMSFFLEFVPVNLCTMEELRLRIVVERGNKANVYIVNICFITAFLGIFKHSLIFLNDASKSVSPEKKIKKETQKVSVAGFDSLRNVYLTIIPRGRVGYEMIDSQLGASRLVGYNHLISNKREWNNCFIKNAHISPTRTNRKRQGTSAIHMSYVYQNCQRANGLAC